MMIDESALDKEKWVQFKIYMRPSDYSRWKDLLDGYHNVLRSLRPAIEAIDIRAVLFTCYGPQDYEVEREELYTRKLPSPPSEKVWFVRLRVHVFNEDREKTIQDLTDLLSADKSFVWDFEVLKEYDILGDLGNRYGAQEDGDINRDRTVRFIRYWDAGCRYILSALGLTGNWEKPIDVWGVPHLINNALGGWLRVADKCDSCGEPLFMPTTPIELKGEMALKRFPAFPLICPICGKIWITPINI